MNDEDDILWQLRKRHMHDAADLIIEQEAVINELQYKVDLLEARLDELGYDVEYMDMGIRLIMRGDY